MMSPSRPASIDANCAGYLSLHWTPNGEGMQAGNPSRSTHCGVSIRVPGAIVTPWGVLGRRDQERTVLNPLRRRYW